VCEIFTAVVSEMQRGPHVVLKVFMLPRLLYRCSVFVFSFFLTQIRKHRCDSYKKRRPCVVSNISTVAISVGLIVAVNPVPANQVGFQQSVQFNAFASKAATNAVIVGTSVIIENFLMTVLSERNFPIFAN